MQRNTIFILSLLLTGLIAVENYTGLMTDHFYDQETLNWQAQSMGQDLINLLLVVPGLLITSWLTYKHNKIAPIIKAGILLYVSYTFTIYCFNIHFNRLFLLYCFTLGLSFYMLCHFVISNIDVVNESVKLKSTAATVTGFYFLAIALLFYFLWLSEIVPASIENKLPQSLADTGLFTNGVQVIDLALLLPGVFITGILLLQRSAVAQILAPVILTFFVLMDITIATLTLVMNIKGIESDLSVMVIMALLDIFSLVLLVWFIRENIVNRSAEHHSKT
ncbi:hypothetical protein [Flavobacterium sp.]|uniref:hypothetical protein n=1 Tax=Flavobacterium sp. TaxID=239 RepID=UPI00261E5834|nr:hypothetical protein [Flavobacterium sp.]